jgi:hypothetical protein
MAVRVSGLNQHVPLSLRLERALVGARRIDVATAYLQPSGADRLLAMSLPSRRRALIGLGFGHTSPEAVERLEAAGFDVALVVGADGVEGAQFHPKLWLVGGDQHLRVLAGSANLSAAGMEQNVEHYEELRLNRESADAARQLRRFENLWELGTSLAEMRRSGAWGEYWQLFTHRRAEPRAGATAERYPGLRTLRQVTGERVSRLDSACPPALVVATAPEWWDTFRLADPSSERELTLDGAVDGSLRPAAGTLVFHLVERRGTSSNGPVVEGCTTVSHVPERMEANVTVVDDPVFFDERLPLRPGGRGIDPLGAVASLATDEASRILVAAARTMARPPGATDATARLSQPAMGRLDRSGA